MCGNSRRKGVRAGKLMCDRGVQKAWGKNGNNENERKFDTRNQTRIG